MKLAKYLINMQKINNLLHMKYYIYINSSSPIWPHQPQYRYYLINYFTLLQDSVSDVLSLKQTFKRFPGFLLMMTDYSSPVQFFSNLFFRF